MSYKPSKPSRFSQVYMSLTGWVALVISFFANDVHQVGFLVVAMGAFIMARIELSDLRNEATR